MHNKDFFLFDNLDMRDFGIFLQDVRGFDSVERDVEFISVPGKSGDVLIDNERFKNTKITYKCAISDDFKKRFADFKSKISTKTGYRRLEDTINPEYYYMAALISPIAPETYEEADVGIFMIEFDTKPQKWLKKGESSLSSPSSIYNPTNYDAKPLIRLYGTGKLTIGDYSLRVDSSLTYSYIDIDCELMNAYRGKVNLNNYVSGDFPKLEPGANIINWTGSSYTITPRWWTI